VGSKKEFSTSPQRLERRLSIANAALGLIGMDVSEHFDPVRSPLCPVDVVMVAGAPWLRDAIERDFAKDESGYKKIGGGANTPAMAYFFRSARNLIYYLKRQGLYTPRGSQTPADIGMACFFDWEDRGLFNFTPDQSGIVVGTKDGRITHAVLAQGKPQGSSGFLGFEVQQLDLSSGPAEMALIGYSDLP
jgi:hypothetical protein